MHHHLCQAGALLARNSHNGLAVATCTHKGELWQILLQLNTKLNTNLGHCSCCTMLPSLHAAVAVLPPPLPLLKKTVGTHCQVIWTAQCVQESSRQSCPGTLCSNRCSCSKLTGPFVNSAKIAAASPH